MADVQSQGAVDEVAPEVGVWSLVVDILALQVHMTDVIARPGAPAYSARMSSNSQSMLGALIAEQRELEARIHDLRTSPRDTLKLGESLLAFAEREDQAFSALTPLLDPAAQAELAAEHQQFAEDLELLEWLLRTSPASPDVAVLTASLIPRMRQHISRDGRLLSRAAALHTSRA